MTPIGNKQPRNPPQEGKQVYRAEQICPKTRSFSQNPHFLDQNTQFRAEIRSFTRGYAVFVPDTQFYARIVGSRNVGGFGTAAHRVN